VRILVTIPARNEANNISRCLASLSTIDRGMHHVEIAVIDNGSTDKTAEIADSQGVIVKNRPGITIGAVRNLALEIDKSADFYAFVDADCTVAPRWLLDTVDLFSDPTIGAVGGYLRLPPQANWVQMAWCLPQTEHLREVEALPSGSLFVLGAAFRKLNGFSTVLSAGEDTELSTRLRAYGMRLFQAPSASALHYGFPSTQGDFVRRQFWHASDYLLTRKPGIDIIFFATNGFTFGMVVALIGGVIGERNATVLGLGIVIGLSFGLAAARYCRSDARMNLGLFAQVWHLNWLYLLGRSLGLLVSYGRWLLQRLAVNRKVTSQ
jgi:glycosyltransferase involved in cell wall biosynthesis